MSKGNFILPSRPPPYLSFLLLVPGERNWLNRWPYPPPTSIISKPAFFARTAAFVKEVIVVFISSSVIGAETIFLLVHGHVKETSDADIGFEPIANLPPC